MTCRGPTPQAPSMRSPNQSVDQSHTKPSSSSPSLAVRCLWLPALSPLPPLHAWLTRHHPRPQERQGILTVSASTSTHSVICESCNSSLDLYSIWPLTLACSSQIPHSNMLQVPDDASIPDPIRRDRPSYLFPTLLPLATVRFIIPLE